MTNTTFKSGLALPTKEDKKKCRKYTKEDLCLLLYYCYRFKREKYGAWEWLGVLPKSTLLEYCKEYNLV